MALAALLAAACVSSFSAPPEPPKGTYAERLRLLALLLGDEDTKDLEPLRASHAAASPDPWMRRKAALALGRMGDREGSPYLTVLLDDGTPSVRAAASFAAGLLGDERLVRFLVRNTRHEDAEVAGLAAEALGKIGGAEAAAALLEIVRTGAGPRAAAARALFRSPTVESVAALAPLAASADRALRREAIYALARKPRPESAEALRAALGFDDTLAAAYAARGLGVLGDADAAPALTRLASGADVSLSIQALGALEKIAAKGPLPEAARDVALLRSRDPIPGVAVAAARLLGRFGTDEAATARLEELIAGGGWRSRVAILALAGASPARAARRLEALDGSSDLELRLGAADAVAALDETASVALAERLLGDPAARVRAGAVAALSADRASRRPALLARALGDADPAVRAQALETSAPHLDREGWTTAKAAWDAAWASSFREANSDFTVTALDAAAARPTGGADLIRAKTEAADAVVREKARRLLVEKFGAPRGAFPRRPVAGLLSAADRRTLARAANETTLDARVETTRGTVTLALALEEAPRTVWNFATLARRGYFDGIVVHRVVPDFVVQAGDPRGDGSGGPGYSIRDEMNPLRYERGALGMALSGPDTGGSQWFVALAPQPHLDGGYTVFGRVRDGMEVLDRTEQDDRIRKVTVVEGRRQPPRGATDR